MRTEDDDEDDEEAVIDDEEEEEEDDDDEEDEETDGMDLDEDVEDDEEGEGDKEVSLQPLFSRHFHCLISTCPTQRIDTKAILPPGSRRSARGNRIDYSSAEARKRAGLEPSAGGDEDTEMK